MVNCMRHVLMSCFLVLAYASAHADEFVCPPSITVTEQPASAVGSEWSVRNSGATHPLSHVSFYDGDPKQNASIVPQREFRSGADDVAVWLFGTSDVPMWLACHYRATSLFLTRQLPLYRECTVRYAPDSCDLVRSIRCK
jgi:hypothetical protein